MSEVGQGSIFVISAPSGSGKTSLANRLIAEVPGISFSISYTTRPPRGQELPGRNYHFVTEAHFQNMIAEDKFLEWANVYGNYYGTARDPILEALGRNDDVLLDIDVKGAKSVKQRQPDAILIFVMPPTYRELERRLRLRGLDGEPQILNRLKIAREEIKGYRMYDYLIVNRDIEDSVERLKAIVLASRSRIHRMEQTGMEILKSFGE